MLDLLVPVDVVDGLVNVGGDPGDGLEALDTFIGGETLPIDGWIEKKETVSSYFVLSHEERSRRTSLGWLSALHLYQILKYFTRTRSKQVSHG